MVMKVLLSPTTWIAIAAALPTLVLAFWSARSRRTRREETEASASAIQLHQLTCFIESLPAAIAMLDREFRIVAYSRSWIEEIGLPRENFKGKSIFELLPDEKHRCKEVFDRCLLGATERRDSDLLSRSNGDVELIRWDVRPWLYDDGQIGGLVLFFEVISDRQKTEEALRASESRLSMALEAANMSWWEWDLKTQATQQSDLFGPLYGMARGAAFNSTEDFLRRVHPDERDRWVRELDAALIGQSTLIPEFRVYWPDGSMHWIGISAQFEWSPDGRPIRLVGVSRDVTQRKQAEQISALQNRILERIARDEPTETVLGELAQEIQQVSSISRAQVVFVDERTERIHHYGPLSDEAAAVLAARQAGGWPDEDVRGAGVAAHPIRRADGCVQGVLIVERASPSVDVGWENRLVDAAMHLAAIALDREAAARRIEKRLDLEKLVAHASARLVCASKEDVDEAVSDVLQRLGDALGVEGGLFLRIDSPRVVFKRRMGLLRSAIQADGDDGVEQAFPAWLLDQIGDGRVVSITNIAQRGGFGLRLHKAGVRSLLVSPLSEAGAVVAAFCFASTKGETLLVEEDIRLLSIVGEVLISAERRLIAADELLRARSELELRVLERTAELAALNTSLQDEIAERAETEIQLSHSREWYRLATRHGRVAMWEYDSAKGIVELDEFAWERIGFEEVQGSLRTGDWSKHILPEDLPRIFEAIAPCLSGNADEFSVEFRAFHRDGGMRWLLTRGSVIRDACGGIARMLGSTVDVTELKDVQRQLEEAKEAAENANQAKSDFLSRMSHELRTPLNAILGFAQLLNNDAATDAQKQDVGMILKAGRHLLDLINEVLDVTRIEAGRLDLSLQAMDLGLLVEEVLELVRPFALRNGIVLEASRTDVAGRLLWADPQRLRQVMLNLLTNALKYNRVGGKATLHGAATAPGRFRIGVTDDGPGLPPELLHRLFTPFDRLGAETTRVEGVGLGLALSKRLVEAMGGELGVENRPGLGCTFFVELPLADPARRGSDAVVAR